MLLAVVLVGCCARPIYVTNDLSFRPIDRKRQNATWGAVCTHIIEHQADTVLWTLKQRRDFYDWFRHWADTTGHTTQWPTAAYYIARQVAFQELPTARLVVKDSALRAFSTQASGLVFREALPGFQRVYQRQTPLNGRDAAVFDSTELYHEQCEVIDSLYQALPANSLKRLMRIAAGKGLFGLAVPKARRFTGDSLRDCQQRWRYGYSQLMGYGAYPFPNPSRN